MSPDFYFHKPPDPGTNFRPAVLVAHLLPTALTSVIAGPIAGAMAALVGAFLEALRKEGNSIERKLDRILSEPLETATSTLCKVLSTEIRDDREQAEVERKLQVTHDTLERALSLARDSSEETLLFVTVRQCIVAALMEGGGVWLRPGIEEFLKVAASTRLEAQRLLASAEGVRRRESPYEGQATARASYRTPDHTLDGVPIDRIPEWRIQSELDKQEREFRGDAAKREREAYALEHLSKIIVEVNQNRLAVLRAPKQ